MSDINPPHLRKWATRPVLFGIKQDCADNYSPTEVPTMSEQPLTLSERMRKWKNSASVDSRPPVELWIDCAQEVEGRVGQLEAELARTIDIAETALDQAGSLDEWATYGEHRAEMREELGRIKAQGGAGDE